MYCYLYWTHFQPNYEANTVYMLIKICLFIEANLAMPVEEKHLEMYTCFEY